MNTAAIEKFAASARRQLMEDVEQRLYELGLSREIMKLGAIPDVTRVTLDGKLLDFEQTNQWKELLERLSTIGYDRVVEQVAYTWFNRFVALRFMEVNGYLPSGVRALSAADADPSDFRARPDIMRHATSALKVDEQLVREMRMAGDDERLYRYLLMAQCTELASTLPFLFEEIEGWIELLFPRNILAEGSIIRRLVAEILEEDWQEQVEIVGWLYQYYISERKNEVYAGFKKNKKASKHDIPPATQLFTPNWIVRYMVDNSLGRLWLESRPESTLRPLMDYYIDEAEQDPKVRAQLEKLIQSHIDPARITVIDPACGSGHILVYAFDLLYEMYVEAGYYIPDIPRMILEHNLYGLDIDERAAQLAAFALMMKARERDLQIFSKGIRPNILAIRESNSISKELQSAILKATDEEERRQRAKELEYLMEVFHDASEYGSLIRVEQLDLSWLPEAVAKVRDTAKKQANAVLISDMESLTLSDLDRQGDLVLELVRQAEIMARKYDVVVTNPPYMGAKNMGSRLKDYLGDQYSRVKADLFSAFIIRCWEMSRPAGHLGFMCPFVWMFISSYEWMRRELCMNSQITTLVQLEYSGFDGATVPICTFTLRNSTVSDRGVYIRLSEFRGSENQGPMALKAIKDATVDYRYVSGASDFARIPGSPIAYWASEAVMEAFDRGTPLGSVAQPRVGLQTSDNRRFLRLWQEVELGQIGFGMYSREEAKESGCRWFPCHKGGEFRKWYGNNDYLVEWGNDGALIRNLRNDAGSLLSRPQNMDYYFLPGITWTSLSSSRFGVRWSPPGFVFDHAGNSAFPAREEVLYIIAFLCSKVVSELLEMLNPTLNFQVGNIADLPILFPSSPSVRSRIETLAQECIDIARCDWDSYETSWDFVRHPFLTYGEGASTIEAAFSRWSDFAESQFQRMTRNEEEINRLFIEIYGLEHEMSPEVSHEDITIQRADRERDVRSFISYAVGCMLGRYSLDEDGLAYAGGEFDISKYHSFVPDRDGVLPVLDDEYFKDDIVGRFVEFVKVCFGPVALEENLEWIATSLGRRAEETSRDTIRRYFLDEFYRDHVRTYRKRPIYWMFSSGRQKAFQALIYMHRYKSDTVALVRTKYLLEVESRIDARVKSLQKSIDSGIAGASKAQLSRTITKLERQLAELRDYDEEMHSLADDMLEIDLDDGVAENYAKFAPVLEAMR